MNEQQNPGQLPEEQPNPAGQVQALDQPQSQNQNVANEEEEGRTDPIIAAILQNASGYPTGTPIKISGEMEDQQGNTITVNLTGDIFLDTSAASYKASGHYHPYGAGLPVYMTRAKVVFKRKHDKK